MKNIILSLVITFVSSAASAAPQQEQPVDTELYHALKHINNRVSIRSRSMLGTANRVSAVLLATGIFATSYTAFLQPKSRGSEIALSYFQISAVGFALSAILPRLIVSRMTDDPAAYQTEKQIKYFFAMPVKRQYRIAAQSPNLRKFILDLSSSVDMVEHGAPAQSAQVTP